MFTKDCKNYEKLEKEYKEDIQLLKSFKDDELEDILHFKQKKPNNNNEQSTQKKHRKIKKIIKPSVNSNENNNTDSSATHSIEDRKSVV